jgi:thioredoxin-disulfide reductase
MYYDLIIIGGGPAGITAGIYAARQKLNTLLIAKTFGGQPARKTVAIENYPGFEKISGQDLIKKFENQLRKQKVEIEIDEVKKVEKSNREFLVSTKNKKKFWAKTVVVASGADPRPLEVPGEKEFLGKGLSYCSVCDGPLFAGKTVAVIGGGNAGFESAIFLSNYTKKIYILEYGSQVGADKTNQGIIKRTKKTEIITNAALKEIKGKNFVDSIVYQDRKTKKEKSLSVQGVFVEIGNQPATSFVKDLVEFNEKDEIKVEFETCQTKTPGIFAVGDANVGQYKQIITGCGEGAKAALAAYGYIQKKSVGI